MQRFMIEPAERAAEANKQPVSPARPLGVHLSLSDWQPDETSTCVIGKAEIVRSAVRTSEKRDEVGAI